MSANAEIYLSFCWTNKYGFQAYIHKRDERTAHSNYTCQHTANKKQNELKSDQNAMKNFQGESYSLFNSCECMNVWRMPYAIGLNQIGSDSDENIES